VTGSQQRNLLRRLCRCAISVVMTLAVLAAAGCGSGTSSHSAQSAATVKTTTARHPGVSRPLRWRGLQFGFLPELPTTVRLAETHWKLLGVTAGNTLLLAVTVGCGLAPIGEQLQQGSSAVEVAIYTHRLPAKAACSQALGTAFVAVRLSAPLAGRRVLA
jgi:hypothetical protein